MKKYLLIILTLLLTPTIAIGATVFYSNQVGSSPANLRILQTDGTNSTWVANSATLSGGSTNSMTYWTSATTVGATTSPTIGNLTATSSLATSFFAGLINIGNTTAQQLNGFGTAKNPIQISTSTNDIPSIAMYNTNTGAQAGIGIFLHNGLSPLGGIGASQTYYGGMVFSGNGWNGPALGFGALPANSLGVYATDGALVLGSATSTGHIDMYTGAGSFAGGVPDVEINSYGNLGVGTSSPIARISIQASSTAGVPFFLVASSTNVNNYYTLFTIASSTGYVGIATSSPNSRLTVQDNLAIDATAPTVTITGNNNFAKVSPFLQLIGNNSSDSGDLLRITNPGTGYSINVLSGTSTFQAGLDLRSSTVQQHVYPSFSHATSTAWTGTTTIQLGVAFTLQTWSGARCYTDVGTLNVQFYSGTNKLNMFNASTTVGHITFNTNTTFPIDTKISVDLGTPASSPTKIACTIDRIQNI